MNSPQWPPPSIQDRARRSNGERQQRHLTNFFDRPTNRPLRRPLESALVNTIVAVILAVFLIIITYKNDDPIVDGYEWFPVVAIALAFLPAPIILGCLWFDAWRRLKPIKQAADDIERRALTP